MEDQSQYRMQHDDEHVIHQMSRPAADSVIQTGVHEVFASASLSVGVVYQIVIPLE